MPGEVPDTLCEVCDAVLCKQDRVHMAAELSLEPKCRRGHGAVYKALNRGQVQVARLGWVQPEALPLIAQLERAGHLAIRAVTTRKPVTDRQERALVTSGTEQARDSTSSSAGSAYFWNLSPGGRQARVTCRAGEGEQEIRIH